MDGADGSESDGPGRRLPAGCVSPDSRPRSPLHRSLLQILTGSGVTPIRLPPRSPNLNAYAERFVRSIKEECLNRVAVLGESHLRLIVQQYVEHDHGERNHQGLDNRLVERAPAPDVIPQALFIRPITISLATGGVPLRQGDGSGRPRRSRRLWSAGADGGATALTAARAAQDDGPSSPGARREPRPFRPPRVRLRAARGRDAGRAPPRAGHRRRRCRRPARRAG